MAKKRKASKPAKASKSSGAVGTAVGLGKKALGLTSKTKTTGRKRKRSALFYAREIQRMKLKKKYDKIKMGV